eukprot:m.242336 g.242336  ORF g.242336 m.242336 type:complete len:150 (+) comp26595_c7_seq6:636-1085(+)
MLPRATYVTRRRDFSGDKACFLFVSTFTCASHTSVLISFTQTEDRRLTTCFAQQQPNEEQIRMTKPPRPFATPSADCRSQCPLAPSLVKLAHTQRLSLVCRHYHHHHHQHDHLLNNSPSSLEGLASLVFGSHQIRDPTGCVAMCSTIGY